MTTLQVDMNHPGYNEDVSFNMSGKSHNFVYTEGGIAANITQSGETCHSTVVTKSATNDRYLADTTSHLLVEENGGNDRIQFASDYNTEFNYDSLGIIFNVVDASGELVKVYNGYRNHTIFVDKDHITAETLAAATSAELVDTVGVNILDKSTNAANTGGIEHIGSWYTDSVNANAWYNAITEAVGNWLRANNDYSSVAEVVAANNADDIASLIEVYQGVNYSNIG